MKQLIDRKLYDTDEAEQIAKYAPNTDRDDFRYVIETLYRTSDEEYFVHGEGGAATTYAKRVTGGHAPGEEIHRLTEEEALDWCEARSIDGEIVIEEFGALIET
jgi:hypothetical protein